LLSLSSHRSWYGSSGRSLHDRKAENFHTDRSMSLFHTIGHSTRPLGELIGILDSQHIRLLVDVRPIPRSRTNPQFNSDTLPVALREHEIDYMHVAELGGRRARQRGIGCSPNTFWENQSFRNFADYALTEPFARGFAKLRRLGAAKPCAIMCSEAVWWRCHRRIIADYLLFAGETVMHIFSRQKVEAAKPTPAARQVEYGKIVYVADLEQIASDE
jgi:uncharacterized protein (DUF488 family)